MKERMSLTIRLSLLIWAWFIVLPFLINAQEEVIGSTLTTTYFSDPSLPPVNGGGLSIDELAGREILLVDDLDAGYPGTPEGTTSGGSQACIEATNGLRAVRGLPPLIKSPVLDAIATFWAQTMADQMRISHDGFQENRMEADAEAVSQGPGANVDEAVRDAVVRFAASPEHSVLQLGTQFATTGCAAVLKNHVWFTCQLFARPEQQREPFASMIRKRNAQFQPQPAEVLAQTGFQPVQPGIPLAQPGFQPVQPEIQQTQPGFQPAQPVIQQAQPGFQPVQPEVQQIQPGFQPAQPVIQQA
jgi:uncharacterized protein YkwD